MLGLQVLQATARVVAAAAVAQQQNVQLFQRVVVQDDAVAAPRHSAQQLEDRAFLGPGKP